MNYQQLQKTYLLKIYLMKTLISLKNRQLENEHTYQRRKTASGADRFVCQANTSIYSSFPAALF